MDPRLASLICACGIGGLFYLDRDESVSTSKALWLPIIWIGIVGSRPISVWMGVAPSDGTDVQLDGSPLDRLIFGVLLAAAVGVLIRRGSRTLSLFKLNWAILIYFSYCLVSVFWSDFPDVSFKRWIKAIGDLAMVLVLVTEADLPAALKRVISRLGFVLLPSSILLIKYFGDLGHAYDPSGNQMNTGVTTNKNSLGVITLVIALGAVWQVLTLLRAREQPNRQRRLVAQVVLLAFGVAILVMAHSATSGTCFALGAGLILASALPIIRRRPVRLHALVLIILLVGGLTVFFGGEADVVHALGRQTDFTGRTDIWAAVLPAVPNAVVGAGFESFWLGPRLARVYSHLSQYMHVNEAHNGYLEMYLNLGWLGVCLIAMVLIRSYLDAVAAFQRDPELAGPLPAYVFASVFYSMTEAGFRLLNPIWIFLLLAAVASSGIAAGVGSMAVEPSKTPVSPLGFSSQPLSVLGMSGSPMNKIILQLQEHRRARGVR